MRNPFSVTHLSVEQLLAQWRWLCPLPVTLVARNAFGDLFLKDEGGRIHWLDVAVGKMQQVAESEAEFRHCADDPIKREEWFTETDERDVRSRGLSPNENQCIAFTIPLVFEQSASGNKPYVAELVETVSFLGDLHRQMQDVPNGGKVQLVVGPSPESPK